jgi:hypothetical protein
MSKETMYIDFSIDYDGDCESIDDFIVNNEEMLDNVTEDDVNKLIGELRKIEGFMVSEHRTQVRIWWYEDGTMSVHFQYFNEPEDGEFDDIELENIPSVRFM